MSSTEQIKASASCAADADADRFFSESFPDYFTVQREGLFWYERLWLVLLRELERQPGRRLLDYGSGPGFLCAFAARRGWFPIGLEPSSIARKHAKGLGVYSSDNPRWVGDGFHAVIATEVLEHIEQPHEALAAMRHLLRPGGLLAISVPNDNNPLQRLFWSKKKPWINHAHKHYFQPATLRRLVQAAGFDVVWQRTSFPVELLLVLPMPRKWAWKLSRIWPAPRLLWRFGVGRHCLLVAQMRSAVDADRLSGDVAGSA